MSLQESWLVAGGTRHLWNLSFYLSSKVIGRAFPAGQHREEVGPTVKGHHQQMAGNERKESVHRCTMIDADHPETSQQLHRQRELHRLEKQNAGDDRNDAKNNRRGVSQFLERIVRFKLLRLRFEQEIVADHRPYAAKFPR